MAYAYKPTYYTSLHDSVTSICKTILPFSFKKKRMPAIAAAEQQRAKEQSDQLKWQQESFHQMHNLMGLCREGILHEDEVSAFRAHLLETLIASPVDYEPPMILRDKLIFLQELLYANCISEDEYHESKRPLLQRLAVQGAEIKETDVTVRGVQKQISNEEWSVIDLKEEKCLVKSASKKTKGASSVLAFVSPNKYRKLKEDKDTSDSDPKNLRPKDQNVSTASFAGNELLRSTENPFWNAGLNERENESKSIFLMESLPESEKQIGSEKGKRKPFRAIFQREQKEENNDGRDDPALDNRENGKLVKKTWGFDGFKKWKKGNVEDERTLLSLTEKSDDTKEPETKKMKNILHPNGSPADGILDDAFGENMKMELSRIQTELSARSTRIHFLDDQLDEVSNSHAVDNAELKKGFPKSSCDRNGQAVAREKHNSKRWTTFDEEEENSHPNLFAPQDQSSYSMKQVRLSSSRTASRTSFNNSSIDKGFRYNPFFDM